MNRVLWFTAIAAVIATLNAAAVGSESTATAFGQLLAYSVVLLVAGWLSRLARAEREEWDDQDTARFYLAADQDAER